MLFKQICAYCVNAVHFVRKSKWARWIINLLLAALLIGYLVRSLNKELISLRDISIQLNWQHLLVAFFIVGINIYFFVLAWHFIIRQYAHISFVDNAEAYSSSQIVKILPTPVWFIAERVLKYSNLDLNKTKVMLAIATETAMQMSSGFAILGVVKSMSGDPYSLFWLLGILPFIVMTIYPPVAHFNFKSFNWKTPRLFSYLTVVMAIYLITWLLGGVFLQFLLTGTHNVISVSFATILEMWITASLVAYLGTFLLGGVGILREFALTFLLGGIGMNPAEAILLAAISRLGILFGNLSFPLILLGAIRINRRRHTSNAEKRDQV